MTLDEIMHEKYIIYVRGKHEEKFYILMFNILEMLKYEVHSDLRNFEGENSIDNYPILSINHECMTVSMYGPGIINLYNCIEKEVFSDGITLKVLNYKEHENI